MSTFSQSFPVHERRLQLVSRNAAPEAEVSTEWLPVQDDGLGCMRGLAVAMLCNIILVLTIAAGWGLWRFLR